MSEERTIKIRITSKQAERAVDKLAKELKTLDRNTSTAGKSIGKMEKGFKRAGASAKSMAGFVASAGAAAGAAAAAILAVAINSARTSKELEMLSSQAKTSVSEFQALSFATNQYGINAEKFADISKDISDKIGEFSKVGTGAFQDFADVTNMTKQEAMLFAREMENLSSDQVIGAVVNKMDEVGASANQQTFVLESLGSDLSRLAPLYAENGKQLEILKRRYDDANSSLQLTKAEAESLSELGQTYDLLTTQLGNAATQISATIAPLLIDFFNEVIEIVPKAAEVIRKFINSLLEVKDINSKRSLVEEYARVYENVSKNRQRLAEQEKKLQAETSEFFRKQIQNNIKSIDALIAKDNERLEQIKAQAKALGDKGNVDTSTGPKDSSGGGGTTPTGTGDELKRIQDRFKTELELLKEKLDAELILVGDNKALQEKLEKEFAENKAKINKRALEEQLRNEKEYNNYAGRIQQQTEFLQAEAEIKQQYANGDITRQEMQYQLENERLADFYENRGIAILENETLNQTQKKDLLVQLKGEENAAMEALEQTRSQVAKQQAESDARFALDFFAGQSKKVFKIKKAVALGEAAVKGVQSAVNAWEAGMSTGGPWAPVVAAGYTAASIAKTGALISQIKSQKYGGGSGNVSAGGGSGVSAGAATGGGDSISNRPDVMQRNVSVENTELNAVRNELRNLDADYIPTDVARRLIGAIDDNLEAGTASSSKIGN